MRVIFVESPNKKRTLQRILGKDTFVIATGGHFRRLLDRTPYQEPPGNEAKAGQKVYNSDAKEVDAQIRAFLKDNPVVKGSDPLAPETNPRRYLAVDADNGYDPTYLVEKPSFVHFARQKVSELSRSDEVILATDPDREGEGIAWHLLEVLQDYIPNGVSVKRALFYELSKKAVETALREAKPNLDSDLVSAYQCREIVDQVIGYGASRTLWALPSIKRALSIGRVQMAALDLLYSDIEDGLSRLPEFRAEFDVIVGKDSFTVTTALDAFNMPKDAKKQWNAASVCVVSDAKTTENEKWSRPPYTLSDLQQDASRICKISPAKTLSVCQFLFETGQITYPRTDSPKLTWQGFEVAKKVAALFSCKTLDSPRKGSSKSKNAQEAHEAIRPKEGVLFAEWVRTKGKNFDSAKVEKYNKEAKQVFDLILRRTAASCCKPLKIQETYWNCRHPYFGEFVLFSNKLLNHGFDKIWIFDKLESKTHLPSKPFKSFEANCMKAVVGCNSPRSMTSARLIGELASRGIGRPSSTASCLETLMKRGYVSKGRLTVFGAYVCALVRLAFDGLLTIETTAELDGLLDRVAAADGVDPVDALDSVLQPFLEELPVAREVISRVHLPDSKSNFKLFNSESNFSALAQLEKQIESIGLNSVRYGWSCLVELEDRELLITPVGKGTTEIRLWAYYTDSICGIFVIDCNTASLRKSLRKLLELNFDIENPLDAFALVEQTGCQLDKSLPLIRMTESATVETGIAAG